MNDAATRKLVLSNLWVAFIAFIVACFMGEYQVLERSGFIPALDSPSVYFASVSTHGVLMAFVLTTFFIMGFGYAIATASLKQPVWNKPLAWGWILACFSGCCVGGHSVADRQGVRALYVLSAHGCACCILYWRYLIGGRFLGLVRHHAGDVCSMEKCQSRATCAFSHVRHRHECVVVAVDQRRRCFGSAVSIDSFFIGLD